MVTILSSSYNNFIFQYDDMSVAAGIDRNPTIAKILSEYFPTNKDRANARVLDLAAGTGLVGKDLHKIGFTNMDAVGKYDHYRRSVYSYLILSQFVETNLVDVHLISCRF